MKSKLETETVQSQMHGGLAVYCAEGVVEETVPHTRCLWV